MTRKILLVAATPGECSLNFFQYEKIEVETLITGAGITATSYQLGKIIQPGKYDLAINVGIAGSFNRQLMIGDVVNVIEDRFADFGAEDGDDFLTASSIGLAEFDFFKASETNFTPDIRNVTGVTVNTVHGNEDSILKVISRLNPDIESMEGAAFFYVCKMENTPCIQIRAISNYVERRNRNNWNINLAIDNLGKKLNDILTLIDSHS